MNPRDLLLLEKHNARPARRTWKNTRRSIDLDALMLFVCLAASGTVAGAVLWFAFRYFREWWPL